MQDSTLEDANITDHPSQSVRNRRTMVDCQIRTFDVTDQRLLARMLEVPRESFLPAELQPLAYSDIALQIGHGEVSRTLLPPFVLARLIQGANVRPADSVLDVGPVTGYSSALLAGLAGQVVALESEQSFYNDLRSNLDAAGLTTVKTVLAPLAGGAPGEAPFDVIVLHGAAEANLDVLFGQLKNGGRLVALMPLSGDLTGRASKAVRYEKTPGGIGIRDLFDAPAPVLDDFRQSQPFTFM